MNLIIDIGNTLVKYAIFNEDLLIDIEKSSVVDFVLINQMISTKKVKSVIVSSVREETDWNLGVNPIILSYKTNFPIKLNYHTPETLGNDRIANAVACSVLYPNKDVLVIDAGSCITMDFIDKNKVYQGGRISPGLKMRYRSLHEFTAKLPKLCINPESKVIGQNTNESIVSGVQQGVLSEVNTIIDDLKKENEDLFVIVTGGDTFFFEKELKNSIFADRNLVLKGLNEILKYNA